MCAPTVCDVCWRVRSGPRVRLILDAHVIVVNAEVLYNKEGMPARFVFVCVMSHAGVVTGYADVQLAVGQYSVALHVTVRVRAGVVLCACTCSPVSSHSSSIVMRCAWRWLIRSSRPWCVSRDVIAHLTHYAHTDRRTD
jgi:hypothetical protein